MSNGKYVYEVPKISGGTLSHNGLDVYTVTPNGYSNRVILSYDVIGYDEKNDEEVSIKKSIEYTVDGVENAEISFIYSCQSGRDNWCLEPAMVELDIFDPNESIADSDSIQICSSEGCAHDKIKVSKTSQIYYKTKGKFTKNLGYIKIDDSIPTCKAYVISENKYRIEFSDLI